MTDKVLDFDEDIKIIKEKYMQFVPEERQDSDLEVIIRKIVYN